ncbi:MAG: hypothetical protein JWO78_1263 [Micavibrio sp.]|nr:hypothetical protein [Micavibrio sp.]
MILNRNLYIAAGIWAVLWAVLAAYLPLFPVDETRYLTVAWEMRNSGDYLLPTLNFAPYSHKPPLLFWLINLIWSVTGVTFNPARLVPLAASLATLFFTAVLARRMFPDRVRVSTFAGLIFMACPVFMIYGIMIMFDFMQAVCVMMAMIALWDSYTTKRFKSWVMLGLAMGLGVLAKGPVILVHVMPVALLFPFFMRKQWDGPVLKHWFGGIGVAILIALLIGLAWAIPAAIHGGPKFTHMIFWEQSAGRVTKSFAHRQPIWFYIPILMAFILPLLCWAPFWRSAKRVVAARRDPAIMFLLCWTIPVFVIFSLISGKQPHYLIPMMPGIAIMIARFVEEQDTGPAKIWGVSAILPVLAGFLFFALIQYHPLFSGEDAKYLWQGLQEFNTPMLLVRMVVVILFAVGLSGKLESQILAMILAFSIMLGSATMEADKKLLNYYDLRPLAAELQQHKDKPVAFAPEYAGEIGFLARLQKPVIPVAREDAPAWFRKNKGGVMVIRYKDKAEVKPFKTLYTLPYRGSGYISIVEAKSGAK